MSREVMQQAQLLCEWITETPHQRGSINGLAAQVLHSISAALAAPQPEKRFTGLVLSQHRDPMNGASIPDPFRFGAAPQPAQCEWTNCPTRVGNKCCSDKSTTPQAPQRQPLTDEQIAEIALDYSLPYATQSFARAIESAHGITKGPAA